MLTKKQKESLREKIKNLDRSVFSSTRTKESKKQYKEDVRAGRRIPVATPPKRMKQGKKPMLTR